MTPKGAFCFLNTLRSQPILPARAYFCATHHSPATLADLPPAACALDAGSDQARVCGEGGTAALSGTSSGTWHPPPSLHLPLLGNWPWCGCPGTTRPSWSRPPPSRPRPSRDRPTRCCPGLVRHRPARGRASPLVGPTCQSLCPPLVPPLTRLASAVPGAAVVRPRRRRSTRRSAALAPAALALQRRAHRNGARCDGARCISGRCSDATRYDAREEASVGVTRCATDDAAA